MLSKDSEFLKREAARQILEANQERQQQMVKGHEARDAETIASDAGRDVTDPKQAGRFLSSAEIQKRLKKLNPAFTFEIAVADPTKMGIYIFDGVSNQGTLYAGRKFVCGMESGITPEFSIRHSDGVKITGETRGWRTVLATLIRHKFIEKYAAESMFAVHFGKNSQNWQKFTN